MSDGPFIMNKVNNVNKSDGQGQGGGIFNHKGKRLPPLSHPLDLYV